MNTPASTASAITDEQIAIAIPQSEWRRILSALGTVDGVFNAMAQETNDQRSREFYGIDKAARARELRLKLQAEIDRALAAPTAQPEEGPPLNGRIGNIPAGVGYCGETGHFYDIASGTCSDAVFHSYWRNLRDAFPSCIHHEGSNHAAPTTQPTEQPLADQNERDRQHFNAGREYEAGRIAAQRAAVEPSQPAGAAGFALVPLRLTREMDEVMQVEGWQWPDLLAAAESITTEQHDEISRTPAPAAPEDAKDAARYHRQDERQRIFATLQRHINRLRSAGRVAEAERNRRVLEGLRNAPLP